MLSDRRQRILCALIEEYVACALPVGSRTITERYHLGVSPATVRNELSALEEEGYITQPHTSAGRIPTDFGYREFVDELLASGAVMTNKAYSSMVKQLKSSAQMVDELIEKTSAELNRLTDCLSIVMAPSITKSKIRQLSLISLNDHKCLIVIVTADGQVINRQMMFEQEIPAEKLASVEQDIAQIIVGKPTGALGEDDAALANLLNDEVEKAIFVEIVDALRSNFTTKSSRSGMTALLKKPEFHDSAALLPIMEILEDDTILLSAIDDAQSPESIVVRIGNENTNAQLSGVSVVAGMYEKDGSQGVVAVIGPKRMDYTKVISAVKAAQNVLDED